MKSTHSAATDIFQDVEPKQLSFGVAILNKERFVDAFVDSGTTLIECRRLGRNGIGKL